jgi:hypothetical protein
MSESRHFRSGSRKPVTLPVRYRHSADRAFEHSATTSDISLGGAFVEAAQPPPVGSRLLLVLSSPTAWDPIEVPGEVRWVREGGFGVRFEELSAAQAAALYELLHAHHYLEADR